VDVIADAELRGPAPDEVGVARLERVVAADDHDVRLGMAGEDRGRRLDEDVHALPRLEPGDHADDARVRRKAGLRSQVGVRRRTAGRVERDPRVRDLHAPRRADRPLRVGHGARAREDDPRRDERGDAVDRIVLPRDAVLEPGRGHAERGRRRPRVEMPLRHPAHDDVVSPQPQVATDASHRAQGPADVAQPRRLDDRRLDAGLGERVDERALLEQDDRPPDAGPLAVPREVEQRRLGTPADRADGHDDARRDAAQSR
jgi:hypothetical protein